MIGNVILNRTMELPEYDTSVIPLPLRDHSLKSITKLKNKGFFVRELKASTTISTTEVRIGIAPLSQIRVSDIPDGEVVITLSGGKVSFSFCGIRYSESAFKERVTNGV